MLCCFRRRFSPGSMSRRPMKTMRLGGRQGLSQEKEGTGPERPVRKETGQPWRLPEGVVSGVFMSCLWVDGFSFLRFFG